MEAPIVEDPSAATATSRRPRAALAAACVCTLLVFCARIDGLPRAALASGGNALTFDCESPAAELVCAAALSGAEPGATYELTFVYRRKGAPAALRSRKLNATADASGSLSGHLYRLRARAAYRVEATARRGARDIRASSTLAAPAFRGGATFDGTDRFATKVDGNASALELVLMGATVGDVASDGWRGLVAVDAEGYVVWGLAKNALCAFAKLEDHRFVVSSVPAAAGAQPECASQSVFRDGRSLTSRLEVFAPSGGLAGGVFAEACVGEPKNYRSLSHTVAPSTALREESVLTVESRVELYESGVVVQKAATRAARVDRVVRWVPGRDAVATVVDLASTFPAGATRDYEPATIFEENDLTCDGGELSRHVPYWMHADGVYETAAGGVLVSIRNFNAVALFDANGGLAWTLAAPHGGSGGVASNFTFADESEAFYAPHAPVLSADGARLYAIDDGTARPGCAKQRDHVFVQCWSRAVAYDLDFGSMTAALAWEVELPESFGEDGFAAADAYNPDGGRVVPLATPGYVLVAFGNLHDNARDAAFGQDSVVLVYDEVAARVVFELRAPRSHWLAGDFTFEAVGSIAGEARHRV